MSNKIKQKPGTWITRDLFESEAFNALKGWAPQLLVIILGKRKFEQHGRSGKTKYVCINCDQISMTYKEAKKKYKVTQPRFTRAIDDLLAKGFLTIIHQGGGYQKDKTIYGLSHLWEIWCPGQIVESRKKDTVPRGFCRPKKSKSTCENVTIHPYENVP